MRLCAIGVSVLSAASVAADPNVTFSFASDVNSFGPTFRGDAGSGVVETLRNPLGLLVDDANGPLPTLSFDGSLFYADFELDHISSNALPSGQVLHTYNLDGEFSFRDNSTNLFASITDGVFTSLGSATTWGSSATIQASSLAGSFVEYTWNGPSQPDYNLFQGQSTSSMTDASFTLTNLISFTDNATQPGVVLDAQTLLPAEKWQSEGSFSGSAFFIPAPASLALLGASGMIAVRRRR